MRPLYFLFTQPNCVWCDRAKQLLRDHDLDFVTGDISKSTDLRLFVKANELTTVPQIYLNGERIGGFDALYAKLGDANVQLKLL